MEILRIGIFLLILTKTLASLPVSAQIPNGHASKNWGLGLTHLTQYQGIAVKEAWKNTTGNRKIVVAIVDTGIDLNHPDLKQNLWVNLGEIPANGLDDDHNGYIDDIHGISLTKNSLGHYDHYRELNDTHGHGTHVAGIIGANGQTDSACQGVAPEVQLMIIKYYNPNDSGEENLKNSIAGLNYAVDNGADIINYSGGGAEFNLAEYQAIRRAEKKGILLVAAAGNEAQNVEKAPYYPASYGLNNIIRVASVDPNHQLLPSSNYGVKLVEVAAPGSNIHSCFKNNSYSRLTGTSQATAFVTGVAVLLKSLKPQAKPPELISWLKKGVQPEKSLEGLVSTSGVINAAGSVKVALKEINQATSLAVASASSEISKSVRALYDLNQVSVAQKVINLM